MSCENTGITHLIHIELALPSSQLSIAGREISNEVMAVRRNKGRETLVSEKVLGTNNRTDVWGKIMTENV